MHDAEDRRAGADAERQRQNRRRGDDRCPPQAAPGVAQVLAEYPQVLRRRSAYQVEQHATPEAPPPFVAAAVAIEPRHLSAELVAKVLRIHAEQTPVPTLAARVAIDDGNPLGFGRRDDEVGVAHCGGFQNRLSHVLVKRAAALQLDDPAQDVGRGVGILHATAGLEYQRRLGNGRRNFSELPLQPDRDEEEIGPRGRARLDAALASPPLNCAGVSTTVADIGESCKGCHQDFR